MRRRDTLRTSVQTLKWDKKNVEVGEQHHMNTVTITGEEESESDNNSVIMTFQYLQINNKTVKSEKLSKYSVST